MIRQKKSSTVCIAGEKQISFLMPLKDGGFQVLASQPLEEFLQDRTGAEELPKAVRQSVNQLLVVPDHSYYLQEAVAYRLHRRLETLGISPLRITTPALIWQTKLADTVDGFADGGAGFVHLSESECLLYFYFMGEFLFSRQVPLTDTGGDADQIYNRLNYEINQSFYLYSQKTKSSVDALFMLAPDPGAARLLSDLLGREVRDLPAVPPQRGLADEAGAIPACRGFSASDLIGYNRHTLTYRPLQKEQTWRPIQWAGFAVGLFLIALLAAEADYLYLQSGAVERQMFQVESAAADAPETVLEELAQVLDQIMQDMARPSGSSSVMQAFLAMPAGVSVNKISLDLAASPRITIHAVIDADHPEAFKATLKEFLQRLNDRFDRLPRPLREQDVQIYLDRSQDQRKALYRINFGFEISGRAN